MDLDTRSIVTPASAPAPQLFQGKMTYLGLALSLSSLLAGQLGAKYPADQVNDTITFIGAHWDVIAQLAGLLMALFGRLRINFRSGAAALLLLGCMMLASCVVPQAVTITKDGGAMVENGGNFWWKADADAADLDVTLQNGVHIVMHRSSTKPEGTEGTKYWTMYQLPKALGQQATHATIVGDKTSAAPGIITAKGDAAAKVIGAKSDGAAKVITARGAVTTP